MISTDDSSSKFLRSIRADFPSSRLENLETLSMLLSNLSLKSLLISSSLASELVSFSSCVSSNPIKILL